MVQQNRGRRGRTPEAKLGRPAPIFAVAAWSPLHIGDSSFRLAAVEPRESAPGRRLWVYLAVLTGAAVVVMSWMVPEPPAPKTTPALPYEHMSYTRCSAPEFAPVYGTRALGNDTLGNETLGSDCRN